MISSSSSSNRATAAAMWWLNRSEIKKKIASSVWAKWATDEIQTMEKNRKINEGWNIEILCVLYVLKATAAAEKKYNKKTTANQCLLCKPTTRERNKKKSTQQKWFLNVFQANVPAAQSDILAYIDMQWFFLCMCGFNILRLEPWSLSLH